MVEKLNLFLDLLQSYKVSFAVLLPVKKLFRASLCSPEGVMPMRWKRAVWRHRGDVAEGWEWLLALVSCTALLISYSCDEMLPNGKHIWEEFRNLTASIAWVSQPFSRFDCF